MDPDELEAQYMKEMNTEMLCGNGIDFCDWLRDKARDRDYWKRRAEAAEEAKDKWRAWAGKRGSLKDAFEAEARWQSIKNEEKTHE